MPEEIAARIFAKINGPYMFPESHSHAFAVTAYQAAWLQRRHPLEFFVSLVNNQPMGFYPVETLKQDARRFGVPFLNPCVNRSGVDCVPEGDSVLLGLRLVRDVGGASAETVVEERVLQGPYAGAFDSVSPNRRRVPPLADFTGYEKMAGEYRVKGVYPRGHLMEFVRPALDPQVLPAAVEDVADGDEVLVAGWPIARQHPKGRNGTVFVTVEDETGDVQVILWPRVFHRSRRELGSHVLLVRGVVSRWDGTTSVVVSELKGVHPRVSMPPAHDWR